MSKKKKGFGDDQGTRVGAPDQESTNAPADVSHDRPARRIGSGKEAVVHDDESTSRTTTHKSGYGGKGGSPDTSSDQR
jgi:hypothetical protein